MSRRDMMTTTLLSTPFLFSIERRILQSRLLIARVNEIVEREGLGR